MLCAPLDWQYAELPSSASDAVLCSFVRCGTSKTNRKKNPPLRCLSDFGYCSYFSLLSSLGPCCITANFYNFERIWCLH